MTTANQFFLDNTSVFESEGALLAYKSELITRDKIKALLKNENEANFPIIGGIFAALFSDQGRNGWQEGWLSLELIPCTDAGLQNLTFLLSPPGQAAIRSGRIILVKSKEEQPALQPWQMSSIEVLNTAPFGSIRNNLLELFFLPNTKTALEKNLIQRNSSLWTGALGKPLTAMLLSDEGLLALEENCFSHEDLNLSGCSAEVMQVLLTAAGRQALTTHYMTIGLAIRFDPAILALVISSDGITAKQERLITFNVILNNFADPKIVELIISPVGRFVLKNQLLTFANIYDLKLTAEALELMLSPPGLVALSKGLLKSERMSIEDLQTVLFNMECKQKHHTPKPAYVLPLAPQQYQARLLFLENLIKNQLIELFSMSNEIFNLKLIDTLNMYINSNRFYSHYFSEHATPYTKFEAADILMQYLEIAYLEFNQKTKTGGMFEEDNIEVCKATLLDLLSQYLEDPAITLVNLQIIKKRLLDQEFSLLKTPTPTPFLLNLFYKSQDPFAHLNQANAMIVAVENRLSLSLNYA